MELTADLIHIRNAISKQWTCIDKPTAFKKVNTLMHDMQGRLFAVQS